MSDKTFTEQDIRAALRLVYMRADSANLCSDVERLVGTFCDRLCILTEPRKLQPKGVHAISGDTVRNKLFLDYGVGRVCYKNEKKHFSDALRWIRQDGGPGGDVVTSFDKLCPDGEWRPVLSVTYVDRTGDEA